MNGTTLKALRLALGFTQQESANIIGKVQLRTWQYWEDSGRVIPADVILLIFELFRFKNKLILEVSMQIHELINEHGRPESVNLTYYTHLESWMTQEDAIPTQWRPHGMAMGELAGQFGFVRLIAFDAVSYQAWLSNRRDNSAMRAQWAALQ